MKKAKLNGLQQIGLPLLIVKAQAKNLCFYLIQGVTLMSLIKE